MIHSNSLISPPIAPLQVRLSRAHGRATHTPPQILPPEGAVLGSEGLLREYMGSGLFVARTHAQILPLCGHWMLIPNDPDLLCVLNGHRLPCGKPHALTPGDTLQIGFTEVLFSLPSKEETIPADHAATEGLSPYPVSPDVFTLPASSSSPTAAAAAASHPPTPSLPAHKELLAQLTADFAASESSRALCCQQDETLDHILASPPDPVLPLLPSDANHSCPSLHSPLPPEQRDQHKTFFLTVGKPFDMDTASNLCTPPQQEDQEHLPFSLQSLHPPEADFLPRLTIPTAEVIKKAGESSAAGALKALGALGTPRPATAPVPGHVPPSSPRTLEEILHGPLSIDDVLHWLGTGSSNEIGLSSMAALENLESVPAPDPLDLLDQMASATQSGSLSQSHWPNYKDGLSVLSPLLQQDHHRADIHTSFSLGGNDSSAPIPPKNREAS